MGHGLQGRSRGDNDGLRTDQSELPPGILGQADFIVIDQVRCDLVEARIDRCTIALKPQPAMRAQAFGLADIAVGTDKGHRLIMRQQPQPACHERVQSQGFHTSSTRCPCSGTSQSQPSSSWIRWRSVSDASGSPCTMKVLRGGALKPESHRMISLASACADSM